MNETTENIISLADIDDSVLINDMNYQFVYKRVTNPVDENTNYFTLHYKESQQEQWSTCRGLLSSDFTVLKTQYIINTIQSNLEGSLDNEKHFRSDTSVESTFTLSGYQIDIEDETDEDRILFQLLTDIDPDLELIISNELTFNIINGFSGNYALQLNYGLLKTFEGVDEDENIAINNIFILDDYSVRLIHDNNLSISIESVVDVQNSIQEKISKYKQLRFDESALESFVSSFPKKFTKKFVSMFDILPSDFQNFYYATYILSVLLQEEKKIYLEVKLRSFISKYIEEVS